MYIYIYTYMYFFPSPPFFCTHHLKPMPCHVVHEIFRITITSSPKLPPFFLPHPPLGHLDHQNYHK